MALGELELGTAWPAQAQTIEPEDPLAIGPEDGDALISLNENHARTANYIKQLRTVLPQQFPGTTFSFLPADVVSQILNFGLPAPIDVEVIGNDQPANYAYATDLLKRIRKVPGIADLRIQQVFNFPQINVNVDRTLARPRPI
jgi:multidrug efflux pump subunit AcrB